MIEMKLDEEGRILASTRLRAKRNGHNVWYIVSDTESVKSAHMGTYYTNPGHCFSSEQSRNARKGIIQLLDEAIKEDG